MNKLLIIFLLFPFLIFGQNDIENIKKDFLECRKHFENNQFDDALHFFSEFHFEKLEIEEIIKEYQKHPKLNLPFIIKHSIIDSITIPIKENNTKYSLLYYSIILEEDNLKRKLSQDELKSKIKLLKKVLGEENITYNEETKRTSFKISNYAYAILKSNQLHWKFIFLDKENQQEVNQNIPKELIISKLNN